MTWRSTLKSKAREHVVQYYDLGGHRVEYNQSIDICLLAYINLRAQIQ